MEIGIIGTGDMGKLYAKEFARVGYKVNCSDLPKNRETLEKDLAGSGVQIIDDGVEVSKRSDLIFYLVPIENIEDTVAKCGPYTKRNAIVSSGTSVMNPSIKAFEKHLPQDASIINWHWLFGPSIKPQGQRTVLVNHKSDMKAYERARDVFEKLESRIIELASYQEHDKITADTQAVTHLSFEAMGTAWKNIGRLPWKTPTYSSAIDNVKVLLCLRIYSGKSHVYEGLAIHNPFAKEQISQYSKSVSDLLKLILSEDELQFRERISLAKKNILSNDSKILLDEKIMQEFNLGISSENSTHNSHLSLLAMADAWKKLEVNPYDNLICQTPLFRLRLGIVENLFRTDKLLEETIQTALNNKLVRTDDLEFNAAVKEWSSIIRNGDTTKYKEQFEDAKTFFAEMLSEGMKKSGELIKRLNK